MSNSASVAMASPAGPADEAGAGRVVALLLAVCPILYMTMLMMLAPLLVTLATEFGTSVAAMGQLNAAASLAWAPAALTLSPLSDRFGRKPLIVWGLVGLGATTVAASFAPTVESLFALRLVGGIAGGAMGPSVNAAVVDYFPPARRGQVLGLLAAGFSLAAVIGVPGVAAMAALIGWRDSFRVVGGALVLLALANAIRLPAPPPRRRVAEGHLASYTTVLRSPMARPLFTINLLERFSAVTVATYLPAFLMLSYGLSLGAVAPVISLIAVGSLVGSVAGGYLASRLHRPTTYLASQAAATAIALPLMAVAPGLLPSAGLGVGHALANNLSRPSYTFMLGQLSEERRGAVMGLFALTNQGGIILGSAVGGLALAAGGFDAVVALAVATGAGAVVVAARWLRER